MSPGSLTEMVGEVPRPIEADGGQVIALRGAGDFVGACLPFGSVPNVLQHNSWILDLRTSCRGSKPRLGV